MDGTVDAELEDVASVRAIISALEKARAAREKPYCWRIEDCWKSQEGSRVMKIVP